MAVTTTESGVRPAAKRPERVRPFEGDARALERDLAARLEGEVRFDSQSRALWATDASNYRHVPIGVVLPKSERDVINTVATCRAHGAPILSRGGGTSLAGQCANVAVVMDFSKYMHHVLWVDAARRRAAVEPGTILDSLRAEANAHGLTFGPDPATHDRCTLGGMIGNNSCGIHAVQAEFYGPGPRTEDNVHRLDVLTYDGVRLEVGPTSEEELARIIQNGGRKGEIHRRLKHLRDRYADAIRKGFPQIPRRVSGYNLEALLPENGFNVARALTGSEGTCVTVLKAEVDLISSMPKRALLVLGYPSVYEAADHVPEIRRYEPVGLEGIDDKLIQYMIDKGLNTEDLTFIPDAGGWLLVEFGADTEAEAEAKARAAMRHLSRSAHPPKMDLYTRPEVMAQVWDIRESGLGATAFVPKHPDTWPGWEDSAVPVDRVGAYLRDLRALLRKYEYECSLYGHFGQGCIHTRIDFDLTDQAGVDKYARFTREAAELVVSYGGALSGEHGDGQARGDLLPIMYGDELMRAFREFKEIWDPDYRMNPGKIVETPGRTSNLRLEAYKPAPRKTHFAFVDDGGDIAHAALRCVGVGKCRRTEGGTMCPSYMALREEKDTTRGRAHLLFEMLQGDVVRDGWKSEEVKDALDLCLACKGCKGDCPVSVDIPTLKSEFLSHYYEGRLRPRSAYAFGLIHRWAPLGAMVPTLSNFVTHAPGLSRLAKAAAGVHPARDIPAFAPKTFRKWYFRRGERPVEDAVPGRRVILWADTFNEHFMPKTLVAALEVLEAAGCEVVVPRKKLCCGRALYDYGMIETAKGLWRRTFDVLGPEIDAGVPVVGVEPSCVAAFRDELPNLFPKDPRARKLSKNAYTLGEYLSRVLGDDYDPPKMKRRAMVHGHCQHKAIMGIGHEQKVLERMGMDLDVLDSGCCGMAGPFGYEKDKYELSMAVGERVLLPEARKADAHTFLVADGFSCREQVQQGDTGRRPLHLAEVIQYALHEEALGAPAGPPEDAHARLVDAELQPRPMPRRSTVLLWAGAAALGAAALWSLRRH